jgi:hypothetical protein
MCTDVKDIRYTSRNTYVEGIMDLANVALLLTYYRRKFCDKKKKKTHTGPLEFSKVGIFAMVAVRLYLRIKLTI